MGGREKKVLTARSSPKRLSNECVISVVASNQTPPYFRSSANPKLGRVASVNPHKGTGKQKDAERNCQPTGFQLDSWRLDEHLMASDLC